VKSVFNTINPTEGLSLAGLRASDKSYFVDLIVIVFSFE